MEWTNDAHCRAVGHLFSCFCSALQFVYGFLVCPNVVAVGHMGRPLPILAIYDPTSFSSTHVGCPDATQGAMQMCIHPTGQHVWSGTKRRRERDDVASSFGVPQSSVVGRRRFVPLCVGATRGVPQLKVRKEFPNRNPSWISDSPMREASLRLDDDDVDDTGMKARRTYTRGR